MINDEMVQKSLDYLRDNAAKDAEARANRESVSDFVKVVLSEQTQTNIDAGMSFSAAESKARTTTAYKEVLEAKKQAIINDENRRFLRQAAEAKIEAWRTFSSNQRAIGKL